jgi:hypothetical protein
LISVKFCGQNLIFLGGTLAADLRELSAPAS